MCRHGKGACRWGSWEALQALVGVEACRQSLTAPLSFLRRRDSGCLSLGGKGQVGVRAGGQELSVLVQWGTLRPQSSHFPTDAASC